MHNVGKWAPFILGVGMFAAACATGAKDPAGAGAWGPTTDAAGDGAADSTGTNADESFAEAAGGADAGDSDGGVGESEGGVDASSDAGVDSADGAADATGDAAADAPDLDVAADVPTLDAATDADAADGANPTGLPACDAPATIAGPIMTSADLNAYGSSDPGPLMLQDERAFVFLEGSPMWMIASHGSATTGAVPNEISGATRVSAWATMTGRNGVTFQKNGKVYATEYDGLGFSAPVETPCSSGGSACVPRVAGDGHLWILTGGSYYEQTPTGFENRGGGPAVSSRWDVDAQGGVTVLATGDSSAGEVLAIWKLTPGAGGWTKAGALMTADVAGINASIEGGFKFGVGGYGAIAPDGSFHLFSDPRCVGTGDHNKLQAYLRSTDGTSWLVETLPSADDLTGGLLTWRHAAFWAGDFDHVRYVLVSSPEPTFDGFDWVYPNRRYDVVARCMDAQGQATFGRVASVVLSGWTQRGFAGFSDQGVATLLTVSGLTQVY
jgi:hypothetical protein